MFKIKITKKEGWAFDIPNKPRIGVAGDLVLGDIIDLDDGKQYFITRVIRTGDKTESVIGYNINNAGYIANITTLPPGATYVKLGASI